MLKFPLVEVNKLSKVYIRCDDYSKQTKSQLTFTDVEEAKSFFLTDKAIEQYNKYCYNQKWQLSKNNTSLHWTISFALDTNPSDPNYVPNSDKWRDVKEEMTKNRTWFVEEHWPMLDHDAEHLF